MWLKKSGASAEEYERLCGDIEKELHFPLSFEGRYKWIVFLNSRTDPRVPVLNRYYGVFDNGTLKLRGIDLRRHDTPEIVRECQTDMLTVLSKANDANEFRVLVPKAFAVMRSYASQLRTGHVPIEHLIIEKRLSKMPDEYRNLVPQAVAAKHLVREGGEVHAGQTLTYVFTRNRSRVSDNRALPAELVDGTTPYDAERYVELLASSVVNLLSPFGYGLERLVGATQH